MPGFCSTLAASRSKSIAVSPYNVGIALIAVAMVFPPFVFMSATSPLAPQRVCAGKYSEVFLFISFLFSGYLDLRFKI